MTPSLAREAEALEALKTRLSGVEAEAVELKHRISLSTGLLILDMSFAGRRQNGLRRKMVWN